MTLEDNSNRIANNTVYLFFRMILVMLVGLYTSRVVLAYLGVEDFGIYNLVGSVVILFSFLQQALTNATHRYLAYSLGERDKEKIKSIFSMSINIHIILAVSVFILCETFGLWFLSNKLTIPGGRMDAAVVAFHFSMLTFCLNIIKTPYNSVIIVHEKMNFYAYTSVVEVVLKLLIVFLLGVFNVDKLILYSVLLFFVNVILFVWYYLQCTRSFEECQYVFNWDGGIARSMVKYSGWSVIVNLVDVGVNQSVVFFFNIFFGVIANAAVGIANNVNNYLNQFLSNFTQSYNPQIIKSYASGKLDYFMKLIFTTSKFSYYLLFLVAVPVAINIDFILELWLKNPPEGTGIFVIMMIAYSLIDAYSAPLWIGVHATGNLKTHQILMASIKILNIPLAYFLLKKGFPAWSALAIKAFLNIICSIVRPIYVQRLYRLPLKKYFLHVILMLYLVSALILPCPIYVAGIINNPWIRLIITTFLVFGIGIPIIFALGMTKKERVMIIEMINNRIHLNKVFFFWKSK